MNDTEKKAVVEAIREKLPNELIDRIVESALMDSFRHFSLRDDEVKNLVLEAVIGRAKELLATTFKDDVDKAGTLLASRLVNLIPRLELKDTRY